MAILGAVVGEPYGGIFPADAVFPVETNTIRTDFETRQRR
jgi:hypothetical protein